MLSTERTDVWIKTEIPVSLCFNEAAAVNSNVIDFLFKKKTTITIK